MLDIERAVPCGLILNELVTNAFTHAFPDGRPGTLQVSFCAIQEHEILFSVTDDGVGLPPGFDPECVPESLGMQVVSVLAKQLEGTIRVVPGPGTNFELRFPI